MSRANERTAKDVVSRWRGLTSSAADRHGLPQDLILAVICQESAGVPTAIRVERGFWRRYQSGIVALIRGTVSRLDDRWLLYPDLCACSYGLMQVMYPVALERGLKLAYPTDLCDPYTGIEAGCRQLRWCLDRTGNEIRRALLRYNGGGHRAYPDEVGAWQRMVNGVVRA